MDLWSKTNIWVSMEENPPQIQLCNDHLPSQYLLPPSLVISSQRIHDSRNKNKYFCSGILHLDLVCYGTIVRKYSKSGNEINSEVATNSPSTYYVPSGKKCFWSSGQFFHFHDFWFLKHFTLLIIKLVHHKTSVNFLFKHCQ